MLPDGVLSTSPVISNSIYPRSSSKSDLTDTDFGPVNISDASQGLMAKVWKGSYIGNQVVYSADGVTGYVVTTIPNIKELSITFDQSGRPCFAYWDGTYSYLYWYDTVSSQFETLQLPNNSYNPRVVLDDKRIFNLANSDVLLCYLRGSSLYIRYQRERYATEHLLGSVGGMAKLVNIGMSNKNRIQFYVQQPRLIV